MILEARCAKCGETFNPADEQDLEHGVTELGDPCGGQGELLGAWLFRDEVSPWKEENAHT